jgi:thiamine-phosphate pyrophosphorylase
MRLRREDLLIYIVTDRSWLGSNQLSDQVEEALRSGATMVQLREKDMAYESFVKEALDMKEITRRYQVPLIINDNIDVVVASDADGVHLGQQDGDIALARKRLGYDKIIGISAHTVMEAMDAEAGGADYIGVGAVFGTNTKKDAENIGMDILTEICHAVTIPVVAIGGITLENMEKLHGTGIAGVAVISAIFSAQNIGDATKRMVINAKKHFLG